MANSVSEAIRPIGAATWACLVVASLTLALGLWQWGRGLEKAALAEKASLLGAASTGLGAVVWAPGGESARWRADSLASEMDRRVATLVGRWLPGKTIYLDNRAHEGVAGVHVLTPVELLDGSIAWVNRGWARKAPGQAERRLREFESGELFAPLSGDANVTIEAVAMASLMRRIELQSAEATLRSGALWQNFDPTAAASWLTGSMTSDPARTWPVIFWQTSEEVDDLIRRIPTPNREDIAKHEGYAIQWWLMTLVALVFGWRLRRGASS